MYIYNCLILPIKTTKCRIGTQNFSQKNKQCSYNIPFALCSTVHPPGPDRGECVQDCPSVYMQTAQLQVQNREWKSTLEIL